VFNPAKGEFVRDARIEIVGTGQTAVSQDEGSFRISRVPPGNVTVVVNYTGYTASTANVQVTAGEVTRHDFELVSTASASGSAGSVVELDAFVVADERAGNAKAIMRQRDSMNIITSLASDAFGDIPDGNVATFIKDLPGVDIEMASVADRTPRLRGLPGDYAQVTIDGMEPASADATRSTRPMRDPSSSSRSRSTAWAPSIFTRPSARIRRPTRRREPSS
jgi:hypothetical protein